MASRSLRVRDVHAARIKLHQFVQQNNVAGTVKSSAQVQPVDYVWLPTDSSIFKKPTQHQQRARTWRSPLLGLMRLPVLSQSPYAGNRMSRVYYLLPRSSGWPLPTRSRFPRNHRRPHQYPTSRRAGGCIRPPRCPYKRRTHSGRSEVFLNRVLRTPVDSQRCRTRVAAPGTWSILVDLPIRHAHFERIRSPSRSSPRARILGCI